MQIGKALFLVRINKAAQTQKRSQSDGGILLHHNYIAMTRNLQFGIIVQIGSTAAKNYPLASVGDEIYFHHSVEDKSERVLDTAENGDELVWVYGGDGDMNYEVYGFTNPKLGLIPSPHHLWLEPNVKRIKRDMSTGKVLVDNAFGENVTEVEWDDPERLELKLEELKEERQKLAESMRARRQGYTDDQEFQRCEDILRVIGTIDREREEITRVMSMPKFGIGKLFAIHEDTSKQLGITPGSTVMFPLPLYPLDIYNDVSPKESARFLLCPTNLIVGYQN